MNPWVTLDNTGLDENQEINLNYQIQMPRMQILFIQLLYPFVLRTLRKVLIAREITAGAPTIFAIGARTCQKVDRVVEDYHDCRLQ